MWAEFVISQLNQLLNIFEGISLFAVLFRRTAKRSGRVRRVGKPSSAARHHQLSTFSQKMQLAITYANDCKPHSLALLSILNRLTSLEGEGLISKASQVHLAGFLELKYIELT